MHDRLKSIKSIAKAIKLRLPFEPGNDNMHDLLDAIVSLCDEPVVLHEKKSDDVQVAAPVNVKPPKPPKASPKATVLKSYMVNDVWHVVGIPKRQPFHEQVLWASNKGADKIKVENDGIESEVLISQIKQQ